MRGLDEILEKFNNGETKDFTNEELELLKIQWYNDSEGELNKEDGIECEKCKNKGFYQFLKNGSTYTTYCECYARRMQIKRARNSGLGEYLNMRSKDFKADTEWQRTIKDKMIEFCQEHTEDNVWFGIVGAIGSGKTMACSIISNHLLYNLNRNVQYVTWTDFISRLKRDMMGDNTEVVSEYLQEIKKVDVLFLDEVLKKYNDTDLKYLMEIINYRYTNNLKTLITSEKLLDELLDIDEATFSRAVEKSKGYFLTIPRGREKNYRLKGLNNQK